jgi:peptide/nickel transport system ATP-binding protein
VLAVDGLTVRFGQSEPVVRQVSFRVAPGEIIAVVGESGSGKSVTARAVLGLLPRAAVVTGSVRLAGRELLGLRPAELRAVRGARVGMVFQEPSAALNPAFTVGWQLAEALRAHRKLTRRQARARAVELLELVGIPDPERRVRHYPHQLSGGQQQRVVIALALAGEPEVIIADEPTTALDVTVQAEILGVLEDLRVRLGTAIVLITHNLGVVDEIADRVVVMRRGQVVEQAPVAELFSAPESAYTRELLDAVPKFGDHRPAPAPDDAVVELHEVSVDYPGRPPFRAVEAVSLRVGRGEVVGLVGESGSGKSTVARVVAGLLAPAAGSVEVFGTSLTGQAPAGLRELRRRIGFVFQDPAGSLNPLLTVGDCIAEPLRVHRFGDRSARRERVAELLDAVRLPVAYAARFPRELSGGQRQRVGLARALALRPDLLIADEPTSALDVSVQATVLELVRRLQAELGFACLFISHDLAVVDGLAHQVAVLRHGHIIEQGPPGRVLHAPAEPYTRQLVAAIPGRGRCS